MLFLLIQNDELPPPPSLPQRSARCNGRNRTSLGGNEGTQQLQQGDCGGSGVDGDWNDINFLSVVGGRKSMNQDTNSASVECCAGDGVENVNIIRRSLSKGTQKSQAWV